jgi:carboxymethylenebutenolidase
METQWAELPVTGEMMPAYVAAPDGAPLGGVIVIQEIFGVNEDMQNIVRLLASVGYLALAPAMFHRTDPHFTATHDEAGFAKGRAAAGAVDFAQLVADLTASADYLHARLGSEQKLGTWGFCFGGSIAYLSATLPFVGAAVSFYGGQIAKSAGPSRPALVEMTAQIQAPLLLAFGGRDPHIPAADIEIVREALEEHERIFDLRVYADEDHGFFREGPDANAGSRDVWPRVQEFLAAHVASPGQRV